MSIELLLEDVHALEAVFTNGHKLSMESLKGFEGGGFGHDQKFAEGWGIATASGRIPSDLLRIAMGVVTMASWRCEGVLVVGGLVDWSGDLFAGTRGVGLASCTTVGCSPFRTWKLRPFALKKKGCLELRYLGTTGRDHDCNNHHGQG